LDLDRGRLQAGTHGFDRDRAGVVEGPATVATATVGIALFPEFRRLLHVVGADALVGGFPETTAGIIAKIDDGVTPRFPTQS